MSPCSAPQRFLPIGDFYFGCDAIRVQTVLGTCVAITLWHPGHRLGGICHYLLPTRGSSRVSAHSPRGAYAEDVMAMIDESLRRTGTAPREYVVKLFGGGNMFPAQMRNPRCAAGACSDAVRESCASVGCRNVHAGRRLLETLGFTIRSEDVGGSGSRQVLFDVWSGDVWVRQGGIISDIQAVAV